MKKKSLTIIIILLFILLTGICINIAKNNYNLNSGELEKNIKEITQKTKIIDANLNHNQALDLADYAKNHGLEMPPILINFDTHSDVYLNYPVHKNSALISNWINEYFSVYPEADELYWVMPREEAKKDILQILFANNDKFYIKEGSTLYGNSLKNISPFKFMIKPLSKKAYKQEFLLNTDTGKMNEYADNTVYKKAKINFDNKNPKLKKITVVTCTEDTLPDFTDKKVFLSIDADYISNSGFDTIMDFQNKKNKKQLELTIYSMVKTIEEKNIKPEIINLTLSPQYLPEKDHTDVVRFFNKFFEISGLSDAVKEYKYTIHEDLVENYKLFVENPFLYFLE